MSSPSEGRDNAHELKPLLFYLHLHFDSLFCPPGLSLLVYEIIPVEGEECVEP
jgi:hypothetical protein